MSHDGIDEEKLQRAAALMKACDGLNPAGIPGLIKAVQRIVLAGMEAKANGWEDHTNFTQTLETALEACYDDEPSQSR